LLIEDGTRARSTRTPSWVFPFEISDIVVHQKCRLFLHNFTFKIQGVPSIKRKIKILHMISSKSLENPQKIVVGNHCQRQEWKEISFETTKQLS